MELDVGDGLLSVGLIVFYAERLPAHHSQPRDESLSGNEASKDAEQAPCKITQHTVAPIATTSKACPSTKFASNN